MLRFNMSGEMNRRLPLEKVSNFSTVAPELLDDSLPAILLKSINFCCTHRCVLNRKKTESNLLLWPLACRVVTDEL